MLGLRTSFAAVSRASPIASSSRVVLPSLSPPVAPRPLQVRFKGQLAPRRVAYRKMQKGAAPMPTGGSLKGTSLQVGQFGIRVLQDTRLTAAQLTSAIAAMRRKIKNVKGAEVYTRVFPDRPVCVKGNETRMGKGKGAFEFWAVWVPVGRVIFEIGGGGIREEIAKQALKLAQVKLPVTSEFIDATTPPRLGSISCASLVKPPAAQPVPAQLAELDAKDEGSARVNVLAREERTLESMVKGMEALSVERDARPEARL